MSLKERRDGIELKYVSVEMPSYQRLDGKVSDFGVLNEGTDEQLDCYGYRKNLWKSLLFYAWTVLNVGFPLLLIHWKPEWGVWWRHSKCCIALADCVLLRNLEKQYFVKKIIKKYISKLPQDFIYLTWSNTNEISGNVNEEENILLNQNCFFKCFTHQELRYVWDHRVKKYCRLNGYDSDTLCSDFFEKFKGYTYEQQQLRLNLFGNNCITIEIKSYWKLFVEEVLNPFYIFQIFSIILWSNDDYYYFAACIFLVSAISMSVSLYKTRKQSETLHEMVSSTSSNTVKVLQKIKTADISSSLLVPGDVIIIPSNGCLMNCDAVLLAGNCIVNESMLTGESVPVTKTPLLYQDGEVYSPSHHKRHTLFCGTKVIQTRYYEGSNVSAVVVRTGFNTSKGELVRAILYPKPIDFKFYRDAIKFIGVLTVIASLGMIYAFAIFLKYGADIIFIVKRVLDIVTIVVPPSLPAAMTVGSVYAQSRLKNKNIFCISPNRINVAGKLKLFCFDKTGTLTEEGLDLWGVVPSSQGSFEAIQTFPSNLPSTSPFLAALATCHSLTIIDGQLTGDPLDLKTFESTQWKLVEPNDETSMFDRCAPILVRHPLYDKCVTDIKVLIEPRSNISGFDPHIPAIVRPSDGQLPQVQSSTEDTPFQPEYEIGIVRQFPFSSTLQMMSVITRQLGKNHMDLYAKGAPEKIISLCLPSSIPSNFNDLLHSYTIQGFRVIAVACKNLDRKLTWHHAQKIKRNELERELNFLGLVVMQNALKSETTPVIELLNSAKLRTVMVTGDNMNTAISVARNCKMILQNEEVFTIYASEPTDDTPAHVKLESSDLNIEGDKNGYENGKGLHLAIEGKSFAVIRKYFPELLLKLAIRGTVFARMTPDQKTQLVEIFQGEGYIVGMCGDGANDCGALKAAHVGISLSESEASVAAPFTSKSPNIKCVLEVIKEGRCALVTSFSVFKFMALYSIIQFISVLILYTYHNNLGDSQFLYIDLIIATSLAVSMGYTSSFHKLTSASPHGTLLGPAILTSIFMQIIFAAAFQIAAFTFLTSQSWFVPIVPVLNVKFTPSMETTIVFCVSSFQYISVALTVSKGKPFRKPLYTNVPFLISAAVLTAICSLLLVHPPFWLEAFFELVHGYNWADLKFRVILLTFAVGHLFLSFIIEYFVETSTFKQISHVLLCKKRPKHHYKILQKELFEKPIWP